MKGSVTEGLTQVATGSPVTLKLEHPMGSMDVVIHLDENLDDPKPVSAGVIRSARKIADGHVYIPSDVWR